MNAIEFVKKYGKVVAVNLHNKSRGCKLSEVLFYDSKNDKYECVNSEDLKQIVDAFEFVNAHRSIEMAKKYISTMDADGTSKHYDKLRTFINLVEKCYA